MTPGEYLQMKNDQLRWLAANDNFLWDTFLEDDLVYRIGDRALLMRVVEASSSAVRCRFMNNDGSFAEQDFYPQTIKRLNLVDFVYWPQVPQQHRVKVDDLIDHSESLFDLERLLRERMPYVVDIGFVTGALNADLHPIITPILDQHEFGAKWCAAYCTRTGLAKLFFSSATDAVLFKLAYDPEATAD